MILSMTGFGSAGYHAEGVSIEIELRTLNSKFLDAHLRLPRGLSEQELDIRRLLAERLVRGKVTLMVDYNDQSDQQLKQQYNEELFVKYYQKLKRLSDRVVDSSGDLFSLAIQAPDVIISQPEEAISKSMIEKIYSLIEDAIGQCEQFRLEEGESLKKELASYADSIRKQLASIEKLDPDRVQRITRRIRGNLRQFIEEEDIDQNRLEQELVFYIEKLDITEEKVRLASHIEFFMDVLEQPVSAGKKLGFISQEIGREINTIGSKANDAAIQKHVVVMKEELEKIKEQILNVV